MRVVITGASGIIGSQLAEELSQRHELRLLDRRGVRGREMLVADLSRKPMFRPLVRLFRSSHWGWGDVFKGADVVVHLAAESQPTAAWREVLRHNIKGTWNVCEAAAHHRVPRVVFASSNWAVKALEQKLAPGCYKPDGPKIGSDAPPFPLTAYGLSKSFGELAGSMFVEEGKLETFVAVRIGNYAPNPSRDEIVRVRWIGVEDIRSLFRRCVEADIKGFHVLYGVSGQRTAPYDLAHTRQALSWSPRQVVDVRET